MAHCTRQRMAIMLVYAFLPPPQLLIPMPFLTRPLDGQAPC